MAIERILSLFETDLGDAGSTATLPEVADRMIYVAACEATLTDPRLVRRAGPDRGLYASGAVDLTAEAPGTRLWSWTLTEGEAPAGDATLKLQKTVELPEAPEHVMRLDRVDFPPGGVALTHVHPGPGIRVCLFGEIGIEQRGETAWMKAGEPWFERGPDPVLAPTTEREATAFVRCMILPVEWRGRNTIRYVNPEDADKPKPQKYHRFVDALIRV